MKHFGYITIIWTDVPDKRIPTPLVTRIPRYIYKAAKAVNDIAVVANYLTDTYFYKYGYRLGNDFTMTLDELGKSFLFA